MQTIAQDITDFRELRELGFIYVDKTALLARLIDRQDTGGKLYFVSRPRRFGKSLMLSTLNYLFQGRRDLFKGLAIDSLDYDWARHAVLAFNFATMDTSTLEAFERAFESRVAQGLREAGVEYDRASTPDANFVNAILVLSERSKRPVVVLIDEYDSPVSHALDDIAKANAIRDELADFYIQIKNNAANIRFMMMTGVTKFTQLSVFSALNNLTDLTLQPEAATLLGYTEEELDTFFGEHLRAHTQVMGLSDEDYRAQLRWWYNGYRFSPRSETKVYNPVAIGRARAHVVGNGAFLRPHEVPGRPSPHCPRLRAHPRVESACL